MNSVFIGGTPNAGKSTLAKKIAEKYNMIYLDLDILREQIWQDPELRYWEDFFSEKDEALYWKETSFSVHWGNIHKQSEFFWPIFLRKIQEELLRGPVIFEAVNILPHLAKATGFSGVFLIADSLEQIYERNKIRPRWGETEELWQIEADMFYKEGVMYKQEAEALGYKVFTDPVEAERELEKLITG